MGRFECALNTLKEVKGNCGAGTPLSVLSRLAIRLLSSPKASSFSERIFSFGGVATSGTRSSTKSKKVNLSQLIKFNAPLCSEDELDNIIEALNRALEDLGVTREALGEVGELWKSVENEEYKFVCFEEEEDQVEDNEEDSSESKTKPLCCALCIISIPLKEAICDAATHNGGAFKCDFGENQDCVLVDRVIHVGTTFHWCPRCDSYDICSGCYARGNK